MVVRVHSLGEHGLHLALNFDVDEYAAFLPVEQPELCEFIDGALSGRRIGGDLFQFFVEELVLARPVDRLAYGGEEKLEEWLEEPLNGLFPGAIEFSFGFFLPIIHRPPRGSARRRRHRGVSCPCRRGSECLLRR